MFECRTSASASLRPDQPMRAVSHGQCAASGHPAAPVARGLCPGALPQHCLLSRLAASRCLAPSQPTHIRRCNFERCLGATFLFWSYPPLWELPSLPLLSPWILCESLAMLPTTNMHNALATSFKRRASASLQRCHPLRAVLDSRCTAAGCLDVHLSLRPEISARVRTSG